MAKNPSKNLAFDLAKSTGTAAAPENANVSVRINVDLNKKVGGQKKAAFFFVGGDSWKTPCENKGLGLVLNGEDKNFHSEMQWNNVALGYHMGFMELVREYL